METEIETETEIKIVKYIDFIYLSNFISNILKNNENIQLEKNIIVKWKNQNRQNYHLVDYGVNVGDNIDLNKLDNEWKIFSICYIDESRNILYFIKTIKSQQNYNYELLLMSIHIYTKICIKYAHLIENYTYLFASVYIYVITSMVEIDEYLIYVFMAQVLNTPVELVKQMVYTVDKQMDLIDVYFGPNEKEKIIGDIEVL